MADIDLNQSTADALIEMEKVRANEDEHDFPSFGGKLTIPLLSKDGRDSFLLDISRGRIDLKKGTIQNRTQLVIPLLRLDFGGSPHTNPDGERVETPHIHIYKEGYGDKWAYPLPKDFCDDTSNAWSMLQAFYNYCKIVDPPNIEKGLFT